MRLGNESKRQENKMSKLSHECYVRLMEESLPEEEAQQLAQKLVDEGYVQTSRRYRMLTKEISDGKKALAEIEKRNPEAAAELHKRAEGYLFRLARDYYRDYISPKEPDGQIELDLRTFEAFRKIKEPQWRTIMNASDTQIHIQETIQNSEEME